MAFPPTIDISTLARDPVEALRGEQSQLEDWIRESFAALEAMHGELVEWQRDLTRRHAEIDQREAAVAEFEQRNAGDARDLCDEENASKSQAIDDLTCQLAVAHAELRAVRKHAEELSAVFDAERDRAMDDHRLWANELREMRCTLQRQGHLLISLGASAPLGDDAEGEPVAGESATVAGSGASDSTAADVAARDAELARRSQ